MVEDVVLSKVAIIERCLARIREEFAGDASVLDDFTVQDSIVLNLQRACEASIDIAMHIAARERLGLPQDSRHAFTLLEEGAWLDGELAEQLRNMVGFRNVAVHEYQKLDRAILLAILRERLGDFEALCTAALRRRSR